MLPVTVALVVVAAVIHAAWNILLKTSGDPLQMSARASGISAAIATPCTAFAWFLLGRPSLTVHTWTLSLFSGITELAYFMLLSAAYQRGELSVVYPLARGTAPLLAVVTGTVVLHEQPGTRQLIAIACLLASIWGARRPSLSGPAVVPALLTGVAIATYSTIDAVGVRQSPPWLFGWSLWAITAVLLNTVVWVRERMKLRRSQHRINGDAVPHRHPALTASTGWLGSAIVGMLIMTAYLMVLTALSIAPLTVVAPLRESAIVLVTIWGVWRLRERGEVLPRLAGAAAITLGAALLGTGST